MRKKDETKSIFCKAVKTINFDKSVLEALEDKARKENTTVSKIVNSLCKSIILTDKSYYALLAKQHYIEFQKYKYMKDNI